MVTPIEIVRVVHIGITSVYLLVDTNKTRVDNIRSLASLLNKAQEQTEKIRESPTGVTELTGIMNLKVSFFRRTLKKIQKVEQDLDRLLAEILNESCKIRILRAETLSARLVEVNGNLEELFRDLTIVGKFKEAVPCLATVNEEKISYALHKVLSAHTSRSVVHLLENIFSEKDKEIQRFDCQYPVSYLLASEYKALFSFSIGKTLCEGGPGIVQDFSRAARYLQFAYLNGQTAAAYYLGNIYYDGKGTEQCHRSAFRYFRVGADNGDADSMGMVAHCYFYGHGTEMSTTRSHSYSRLAANAGSPFGMRNTGYDLLYGVEVDQNWTEAKRLLEGARQGGHFRANCELAKCYEHGIIVERDEKAAFELLKEAYEKKVPLAVSYLARCYEEGIGTQQDLPKAAELYREIANRRTFEGKERQALYGMCLVRGRGVKQNIPLGMRLIQGGLLDYDATAWFVLGKCYQNGYGLQRNIAKAIMCFVRGANATNSTREIMECNIALAEMYETGNGLLKDLKKAIHHYSFAVTRIHVVAQWKMGLFYESGEQNIERNIYLAFDFFNKAARGGHAMAMRKAGFYYMKGIGVPRDRSQSKRLLKEAMERGDDSAPRILRSEKIWRL